VNKLPRTLALALGLAALSSGCGASGGAGSLSGLAPGTTTLRIVNHVGAPGALDGVSIAVDGEAVPLTAVPPRGASPAVVAALRLGPGAHTIAVRARAHAPGSDVIVIGAQQGFHLAAGAAAITIDVRSGEAASSGAAEPIAVSLAILGGSMDPDFGAPPAEDRGERCAPLLPTARALCRAAVELDDATRRSDVVAALCVRDKLGEMRRLALISESGKGDAVSMVEGEIAALSRQVERCIGGVVASPGPDGVTVTRPAPAPAPIPR
jgi:hypothetical protein